MSVRIVEPLDYEQHVATCSWPHHWRSALGVYDQWGQRVNGKPVMYCGTSPTPPPGYLTEIAPFWPGCVLALWVTGQEMPWVAPARLSDGPQPDLTFHPEGTR